MYKKPNIKFFIERHKIKTKRHGANIWFKFTFYRSLADCICIANGTTIRRQRTRVSIKQKQQPREREREGEFIQQLIEIGFFLCSPHHYFLFHCYESSKNIKNKIQNWKKVNMTNLCAKYLNKLIGCSNAYPYPYQPIVVDMRVLFLHK